MWAHNHTRNPKARPALLHWINNVTFDYDIGFILGDSASTQDWKANVLGSWFISPPGNLRPYALEKARLQATNGQPNFSLYIEDSAMDANGDTLLNASKSGYAIASGNYRTNGARFPASGIPVQTDDRRTAYKKVLSAVGPLRLGANDNLPLRDELDSILISNISNWRHHHVHSAAETGASNEGYGELKSAPALTDTDADGMPDVWENAVGSNPHSDDHGKFADVSSFLPTGQAGYTLLEEYLNFRATPHAWLDKATQDSPTFIEVDLHRFTSGFTNQTPVRYFAGNATNGRVEIKDGHIARFEPKPGFTGRARFDFTVTDNEQSTWTQPFFLMVAAPNPTK